MAGSRVRGRLVATAMVFAGTVGLAGSVSSAASPSESAVAGWPRQLGSEEFDQATGVAVGSSGEVYMFGYTFGALPGNTFAGAVDAFLARYDKYGRLVWATQFGTSGGEDSYGGVAVSGSAVYVSGTTSGAFPGFVNAGGTDAFLARFSTSGTRTWVKQFGSSGYDSVRGLAVSGGAVYLSGYTDGTFPGFDSAGGTDAFLARFSTSGTRSWVTQFGTDGYDRPAAVAVSGSAVYLTGYTEGAFPGFGNAGQADGFLARYSTSGTQGWVKQFGTGAYDFTSAVAVSGSAVYLTGYTPGAFPGFDNAGKADGFVARYSTSGAQTWLAQFGTGGYEFVTGLAVSGAVYVTGSTDGAFPGLVNAGGNDGLVARFSTAGVPAWVRQFGTAAGDIPMAVAVRSSDSAGGAVVVVGQTAGTVWGQVSAGAGDAFVSTFLK